MVKRQKKKQREEGERKRKAKRLLAGGDGKFGAEKKKQRKKGRLFDSWVDSIMFCKRECIVLLQTLSESPNSVNHC